MKLQDLNVTRLFISTWKEGEFWCAQARTQSEEGAALSEVQRSRHSRTQATNYVFDELSKKKEPTNG